MEKQIKVINKHAGGGGGAVYGLGLVGALVYYLTDALSFGDGIVGVLKAIVWPAFVVFKLHELFKL